MAREIYSFDEDKMVTVEDKPTDTTPLKETPKAEEETEEETEEEEKDEKIDSDKKDEEAKEEEPTDGDEPEEELEEKAEEEQPVDIDNFIADNFADKYGIKNEEEFVEVIDRAAELLDENIALNKKVEELEKAAPKEPVFKSENQKAVFEALKDYDPDKLPDGIQMIAGLININLDKTDPKLILEQKFIMQHPELSIDESRRKFARRFESKYAVKEEDFDSIEAYKDKKEDLESDLKIEAAEAKKFIQEKQKEFKTITEEKPKPEEEVNQEVLSSIASNTKAFDEHFNGLEKLIFEVDDSKDPFIYKFSKEQLAKIKVVAEGYLKNANSYDKKGKIGGGFDPESTFQGAAFALYGPAMMEEALKSARTTAQIIKAEDIGKKKPDRKAKSSGDIKDMSIDAQTDRLMAKKKAEREAARGR